MMGCQNLLQWVQFGNLDAYCMRKGGENEVNNTSATSYPLPQIKTLLHLFMLRFYQVDSSIRYLQKG